MTNIGLLDTFIFLGFINHHNFRLTPKPDHLSLLYFIYCIQDIRAVTSYTPLRANPNLLASHSCWKAAGQIWRPSTGPYSQNQAPDGLGYPTQIDVHD